MIHGSVKDLIEKVQGYSDSTLIGIWEAINLQNPLDHSDMAEEFTFDDWAQLIWSELDKRNLSK
jgi:hypothetical protein